MQLIPKLLIYYFGLLVYSYIISFWSSIAVVASCCLLLLIYIKFLKGKLASPCSNNKQFTVYLCRISPVILTITLVIFSDGSFENTNVILYSADNLFKNINILQYLPSFSISSLFGDVVSQYPISGDYIHKDIIGDLVKFKDLFNDINIKYYNPCGAFHDWYTQVSPLYYAFIKVVAFFKHYALMPLIGKFIVSLPFIFIYSISAGLSTLLNYLLSIIVKAILYLLELLLNLFYFIVNIIKQLANGINFFLPLLNIWFNFISNLISKLIKLELY